MNTDTEKDTIPQTDKELAQSWGQGDLQSAGQLYKRYKKNLLFYFFLRVENYEDARDLLGETFVRVAQNIGLFRGESSFRTWLYAIAGRLINTYFYKKKQEKKLLSKKEYPLMEREHDRKQPEQRDDLDFCLHQLTPRTRTILCLLYQREYGLRDIATLIGLSHEGVRKVKQKGLEALKVCLNQLNPPI